ncbi:MAG: hypothetical protein WB392_10445 [Methanotrichaceae archaeon]
MSMRRGDNLMPLFVALALLLLAAVAYAEDNNVTPGAGQDIQFVGTLLNLTEGNMPGAPDYWTVKVDEVLLGAQPCNDTIKVVIYQSTAPPWGTADKDVKPGDKAWISGRYVPKESGCEVTLQGSDQYYLRKYPDEIKFVGTVSGFNNMAIPGGGPHWLVNVDNVLSGPKPCSNHLSITTFQAIYPPIWGKTDPDIKSGDKVEVFGAYYENKAVGTCSVTLYGSKNYYIKKLGNETNSIA